MSERALVVLDYSGTLSLGAVLFGRDESLLGALQESGLWELGVSSVQTFWQEIVNPTWEVGSTTACGYRRILCQRVRALAEARGLRPAAEDLQARAGAFVERYLAHSAIDAAWGPLLRDLAARPTVTTVVATDHYAEATAHIVAELEALGVAAAPALEGRAAPFLVANSADLGAHKADRAFWERVKSALGAGRLRRAAVVDDFGANEQPLDRYADRARVQERVRATVEMLAGVFGAPVEVFRFWLPAGEAVMGAYRDLIRQAGESIPRALAG